MLPKETSHSARVNGLDWRHLTAGAVAGIVSKTMTAPLDRLKTYAQVTKNVTKFKIIPLYKELVKEGGFFSLWRGNSINVVKVTPEIALKFSCYDWAKRMLQDPDNPHHLTTMQRFIAGASAGFASQTIIYPLDVMKTRLTLSGTQDERKVWRMMKKAYAEYGVFYFFKGYGINTLGAVAFVGADLCLYETSKSYYMYLMDTPTVDYFGITTCGLIASFSSLFLTYPISLVATNMQALDHLQLKKSSLKSFLELVKSRWASGGIRNFYRGTSLALLKGMPQAIFGYVVYECVLHLLGGEMT